MKINLYANSVLVMVNSQRYVVSQTTNRRHFDFINLNILTKLKWMSLPPTQSQLTSQEIAK